MVKTGDTNRILLDMIGDDEELKQVINEETMQC